MTTHEYPIADPGGKTVLGEPLWRDIWWTDRLARAYGSTQPGPTLPRVTPEIARTALPEKRKHVRKSPEGRRPYASRYVGVTTRRGRWMAQWGPRGRTICRVFTSAPEDEERAAWARADALGLSELEVRG